MRHHDTIRFGQTSLGRFSLPTIYADSEFKNINTSSFPTENSTETNLTHQQLIDLELIFQDVVALSPSRVEEGGDEDKDIDPLGYDVKFDQVRELFLQHKAPKNAFVRGFSDNRQWLKFNIDHDQLTTLVSNHGHRSAFYALPLVTRDEDLGSTLCITVFVDIQPIMWHDTFADDETTYLLVEYNPKGAPYLSPGDLTVYGHYSSRRRKMIYKNRDIYYKIPSDVVYDWGSKTGRGVPMVTNWWSVLSGVVRGEFGTGYTSGAITDGGDRPYPPISVELDFAENVSEAYRKLALRRRALYEYTTNERRDSELENWLVNSLYGEYPQERSRLREFSSADETHQEEHPRRPGDELMEEEEERILRNLSERVRSVRKTIQSESTRNAEYENPRELLSGSGRFVVQYNDNHPPVREP